MSNSTVRPCKSHNSIDLMGLVVFFDGTHADLLEVMDSNVDGVGDGILSYFSKTSKTSTKVDRKDEVVRLLYTKEGSDGSVEWACRVSKLSLGIYCHVYRRWAHTLQACMEILKLVESILGRVKISGFLLGYLDKFIAEDYGKISFSSVFKETDHLPKSALSNNFLRTETGFIKTVNVQDKPCVFCDDIKVFLEFDQDDAAETFDIVIDTSSSYHFQGDLPLFADLINNKTDFDFKGALQIMHDELKKFFAEIVHSNLLEQVGIKEDGK